MEPILSNLGKFFANKPNFETFYRGSDGKYHPGPAEIITKALVEGLAPERVRQDVKVKLQHAGNWKADPDLVIDTVVAEAKEWRRIEAFSQSSTSTPPSRPGHNECLEIYPRLHRPLNRHFPKLLAFRRAPFCRGIRCMLVNPKR